MSEKKPKCPKCREELEVEECKFLNVHRCNNCGFEGIEEPLSKIYRIIKREYSNVR